MPVEQVADQTTSHNSENCIGMNLELLDDYKDDAELQLPPTPTSVWRYPARIHRSPMRFRDYVQHYTGHLLERGEYCNSD